MLQNLLLSTHNTDDCGGFSVYIEIISDGKVICKTKASNTFRAGSVLRWNSWQLGSCDKKEFDINSDIIKFKAKTSHSTFFQNDDFCPKKLTVNMSSNRKFESDIMMEWVDKIKNSNIIRTAKLEPSIVDSEGTGSTSEPL